VSARYIQGAASPQALDRGSRGRWLFPLLLLATLPQNYYDLSAIFAGQPLALYTYQGPIVLKLGKDFVYLLLFGIALWDGMIERRSPLEDFGTLVVLIIGMLFAVSLVQNGAFVALIGVRWTLPFLLFFVLRHWASELDTRVAARWVMAGLVLAVGAQFAQVALMPPVYGEVLPGIPARTPGIFLLPNSAAFFGCSSAACILAFPGSSTAQRGWAVLLSIVTSALAQSGTGVIVSMVLALRWMTTGRPLTFWCLTVAAVAAVFPNLEQIMGREVDYLAESGGGRIEVLLGIARDAMTAVDNFGSYTNAANLQADNPAGEVAVDSLVAAWIGNFGLAALPVLFLVALFAAYRMDDIDWKRAAPCVLVLVLFSFTTVVFEAFPMNLYLLLGIWGARKCTAGGARPAVTSAIS
jgi:hypothetical protein